MIDWAQLIISNILVAMLIGGLAWLVGRSGQRAHLAHLLWIGFFVKLVTPPIIILAIMVPAEWLPQQLSQPSPFIASAETASLEFPESATLIADGVLPESNRMGVDERPAWPKIGWWHVAVVVWCIGFVYLTSRGVVRFVRFHRLLQREGTVDEEATQFVGNLIAAQYPEQRARLRRTPQVLRIPLRVSPMLFGIGRRAVIVCPDILWKSFDEDERQSFLAHETAHYCRRDHWVRWLEWLVTAAYWWLPAVYVARKQLERHEEACCDAWAVNQLKSPPRRYAEALLKAVDFISEQHIGIPRLASGMRQTNCLEERLRFVMLGHNRKAASPAIRYATGVICVALLLLHPIAQPASVADIVAIEPQRELNSLMDLPAIVPEISNSDSEPPDTELPEPPTGFWNRSPLRHWAGFSLSMAGANVIAEAGQGIRIQLDSGNSLKFSTDELRAIVDIPSSKRVIIGSADGSVRLWDLNSGLPVSLIGRHPKEVTSVAYNADAGLITSDAGGSVMRWNMQSGQVLSTMSLSASSVQSVRFSNDGNELAVLTGLWNEPTAQVLHVADSRTLETIRTARLQYSAAVVVPSASGSWLAVDWSGTVWEVESQAVAGRVSKEHVSALVLTQNQSPNMRDLNFIFFESQALPSPETLR